MFGSADNRCFLDSAEVDPNNAFYEILDDSAILFAGVLARLIFFYMIRPTHLPPSKSFLDL